MFSPYISFQFSRYFSFDFPKATQHEMRREIFAVCRPHTRPNSWKIETLLLTLFRPR